MSRIVLPSLVGLWLLPGTCARAQTVDCLDERPGYVVRSVIIKARWIPDTLALPVKRGDPFEPRAVNALRRAFIRALSAEKEKTNSEMTVLGKTPLVALSYVRACGLPVPPAACQAAGLKEKCTDVLIQAQSLSIDTFDFGSGLLLPIPRSNEFTFLTGVPPALRIFNPVFGVTEDQKLGTMPKLAVNTDLLALPKLLNRESPGANKAALTLKAEGSRSLGKRFYTSQVSLNWALRQLNEQVESLGFEASFAGDHLPQKEDQYWKSVCRAGGHLALNPAAGLVNRVVLHAAFRRSNNRLARPLPAGNILTTEKSFEGRVLLDGRIRNDFLRAAFWLDGGKPEILPQSYHRVAGAVGYSNEIPVRGHTIGIETLFGAGFASDHVPDYARFYGGNTQVGFLYDDVYDLNFVAMPPGPLLRGAGRNQAGARTADAIQRGGSAYQHFNLTVSIPIPRLSYPLIPDETIGPDLTLRSLVKNFAVGSGEDALSMTFQDEGLSEAEANRKARQIFNQIRPGVNFLVDYAKVFALKPLFMFDVARISIPGSLNAPTRYGIGGGLQLTIVVAKFEVGYMRAVHRYDGDPAGNFVARLVFQNLF